MEAIKLKIKNIFLKVPPPEVLIITLNPIIRGWANYYKNVYRSEEFVKLDYYVFLRLRKYLNRLHPNKSWEWIITKYQLGTYPKWTLKVTKKLKKGKTSTFKLIKFMDHKAGKGYYPKIKSDHNPYLNQGQYLKTLLSLLKNGWGKVTGLLKTLMSNQKATCPICQEILGDNGEYDIHHIKPVSEGGSDTINNLVVVHLNCHNAIHHGNQQMKPE